MAIQISGTTVIDDSRNIVNNDSLVATSYFNVPSGTGAERPGSPSTGSLRWNTDLSLLELYNGSSWVQVLFD